MSKYLQVWISAENQEQANDILNALLDKKLVTGGQIINAPARFWWKGKIQDMDYFNLSTFTIKKYKKEIITEVKKVSIEEVPMVWFVEIDANKEFTEWITNTLKK